MKHVLTPYSAKLHCSMLRTVHSHFKALQCTKVAIYKSSMAKVAIYIQKLFKSCNA